MSIKAAKRRRWRMQDSQDQEWSEGAKVLRKCPNIKILPLAFIASYFKALISSCFTLQLMTVMINITSFTLISRSAISVETFSLLGDELNQKHSCTSHEKFNSSMWCPDSYPHFQQIMAPGLKSILEAPIYGIQYTFLYSNVQYQPSYCVAPLCPF